MAMLPQARLSDERLAIEGFRAACERLRALERSAQPQPEAQTVRNEVLTGYVTSVANQHEGTAGFYYWRALLGHGLARHKQAHADIERSLALAPNTAAAHALKAEILKAQGAFEAASAAYEWAMALNPTQPNWPYNLGLCLAEAGQIDRAANAYRQTLALNPEHVPALNNLALLAQGFGAMGEALALWGRATRLAPRDVGVRLNLALALMQLQDFGRAEPELLACLAADASHPPCLAALAGLYAATKRHARALSLYRDLARLDDERAGTGLPYVRGHALHTALQLAHWEDFEPGLAGLLQGIKAGRPVCTPFALLALLDDPALHLTLASHYAQQFEAQAGGFGPCHVASGSTLQAPPECDTPSCQGTVSATLAGEGCSPSPIDAPALPIRIGYFSSDFHEHATAYLMAELIEKHDRRLFEVFLFSYGKSTDDAMQRRLAQSKVHWVDCAQLADGQVVASAQALGVELAIDLKGYTFAARPGIFARRCAPIQVSYLGYPGTLGSAAMDYVIADRVVVPDAAARAHFREAVIRLPVCYQVNDQCWDDNAEGTMPREALGLDAQAVVFCSFNNTYKILPEVFADWMQILGAVPHSQLWLLHDSDEAAANLRAQAIAHGIEAERLVFAPRVARTAHLARQPLADVFLDTFPYNAHTTASDALRRGVIVLTRCGQSFASRVAASLLHSLALDELVVDSRQAYVQAAIALGLDAPRRQRLRAKLCAALTQSTLFSAQAVLPWLEASFLEVVGRHRLQQVPCHFDVDEHMLSALNRHRAQAHPMAHPS
jgi:predicted O-linked N-acetylglucosamine transferase (SPINDLY family)